MQQPLLGLQKAVKVSGDIVASLFLYYEQTWDDMDRREWARKQVAKRVKEIPIEMIPKLEQEAKELEKRMDTLFGMPRTPLTEKVVNQLIVRYIFVKDILEVIKDVAVQR